MRPDTDPDREPDPGADPLGYACPYGDRYAHTIPDLLADPDLHPCPLGYACPVWQSGTVTVVNTSSNADALRVALDAIDADPEPHPAAD